MATILGKFASVIAVEATSNGTSFSALKGVGLPWAELLATSIKLYPGRYLIQPSGVTEMAVYRSSPWSIVATYPAEQKIVEFTEPHQLYFKGAGNVAVTKL